MKLVLLLLGAVPLIAVGCNVDEDCNLNGLCTAGSCACNAGERRPATRDDGASYVRLYQHHHEKRLIHGAGGGWMMQLVMALLAMRASLTAPPVVTFAPAFSDNAVLQVDHQLTHGCGVLAPQDGGAATAAFFTGCRRRRAATLRSTALRPTVRAGGATCSWTP